MVHFITGTNKTQMAKKDMDWNKALSDVLHLDKAITAREDDFAAASILIKMERTDANYKDAVKYACSNVVDIKRSVKYACLHMLHIKRSLAFKARKVKQSFKEDTEQAARSGFIYYFSVVKLHAVKMTLLKKR